jgi:hypothetical protein
MPEPRPEVRARNPVARARRIVAQWAAKMLGEGSLGSRVGRADAKEVGRVAPSGAMKARTKPHLLSKRASSRLFGLTCNLPMYLSTS